MHQQLRKRRKQGKFFSRRVWYVEKVRRKFQTVRIMPTSRMLMLQHEKLAMAQSANFQFSSNYGLSELFNFRISA